MVCLPNNRHVWLMAGGEGGYPSDVFRNWIVYRLQSGLKKRAYDIRILERKKYLSGINGMYFSFFKEASL